MWSKGGNVLLVGWLLSITGLVAPIIHNVPQHRMSKLSGPNNELGRNNIDIKMQANNQYVFKYIAYNPLTWKWKMDHVDEHNLQATAARKTQPSSFSSLSSSAVPRIYHIYQVMIINKCLIKSILSIYHRHCIEGHLLDPSPLSYMFLDSRWNFFFFFLIM